MKEFINNYRKTNKIIEGFEELLTKENLKKLNKIIKQEKIDYQGSYWETKIRLTIKLPYVKKTNYLEIKFESGKIKVIFKDSKYKKLWQQNYYSNKAFFTFLDNYKSYKKLFKRILKEKNIVYKIYLIDGKLYKTTKSKEELKEIFKTKKIFKVKNSNIKII